MNDLTSAIPDEVVLSKVFEIRGEKVMLDRDLAQLYGVETRVLKQAVRRKAERFPADFMFALTTEEWNHLRSQFVTSSWGGTRYRPMAFTEQGVAMLSSVLNSPRAIQVNIQIIRVFTRLRLLALTQKDVLLKLQELESKVTNQDQSIRQLFDYLKQFVQQETKPRPRIGFKTDEE